ncbi:3-oxoacyl-ACP synthase, partial [Helicobacter pylori]
MEFYASLKSIAMHVPSERVKNAEFQQFLDTSDEWIEKRTGIKERRFANDEEKSSDLGVIAAKQAIERAHLTPQDIDLVVVATLSPDFLAMPSTACVLSTKLGIENKPAFDISAACTGFIYLLSVAKAYVESGICENVLIVGAEKTSSVL